MITEFKEGKKYTLDFKSFRETEPSLFSISRSYFRFFAKGKAERLKSTSLEKSCLNEEFRWYVCFDSWENQRWCFKKEHLQFFTEIKEYVQEELDV